MRRDLPPEGWRPEAGEPWAREPPRASVPAESRTPSCARKPVQDPLPGARHAGRSGCRLGQESLTWDRSPLTGRPSRSLIPCSNPPSPRTWPTTTIFSQSPESLLKFKTDQHRPVLNVTVTVRELLSYRNAHETRGLPASCPRPAWSPRRACPAPPSTHPPPDPAHPHGTRTRTPAAPRPSRHAVLCSAGEFLHFLPFIPNAS